MKTSPFCGMPPAAVLSTSSPPTSPARKTSYTLPLWMTRLRNSPKTTAMSSLYSSSTQGFTESFLRRPHSSRDLLGACLADSSFPDGAKKHLIQSVSLQFPCRALLHQWGKEDSPDCPFCNERESLGHIQSRCKILENHAFPPIT